MRKCLKIIVRGDVQGVFYRKFVQEQADKIGIEGTVQNASDGSVIINAKGLSEKLDDFIDFLYQGSKKSRVQEVIAEPLTVDRDFRGIFRIIGTS